jgi:transposase
MTSGSVECKDNSAAYVKTMMPGRLGGLLRQRLQSCVISPTITRLRSQKELDTTSNVSRIKFTKALEQLRVANGRPGHQAPDAPTTGTLNPRPKAVRDELFLQDEFFDTRDLVQVKYEMLRRVRTEGKSVTNAAANFGFSRPSFYQAQAAFEQNGLAGLVPHKRGPKQAHKLTEEILTFIGDVRQKEPSIRLPDLVRRIQERFGTKVHPRSIERSLLRHQKKR